MPVTHILLSAQLLRDVPGNCCRQSNASQCTHSSSLCNPSLHVTPSTQPALLPHGIPGNAVRLECGASGMECGAVQCTRLFRSFRLRLGLPASSPSFSAKGSFLQA